MESINLEEYVKSLPRHELLYMDKIYYEKRRKDQIYPFRMYHGHKDEKSELTFHPKVNKKSKRLYKKRFLRTAEKMEKVVGGSEVKSKKRRSRADRKGVQHCVIEMRRSEVFDEEKLLQSGSDNKSFTDYVDTILK
ncbi:unnamed protein product [Moneuplotes crassus]|uniref:Uncharacterized protein n=1 Tax=Euplotes crassus TaxID=5936 RepID=A0AAD1Y079_EUPCR|nr:unnamed protein product [Moneuplotes crassus]